MQDSFEIAVDEKTYNCKVLDRIDETYLMELHETGTGSNLSDIVNRCIAGERFGPVAHAGA